MQLIKHSFIKLFEEFADFTIDKTPILLYAFKKLKNDVFYIQMQYWIFQHINNIIRQKYQPMKHRFINSASFQNLLLTSRTLKYIETVQSIVTPNN
ncbi:hypothetical protein CN685_27270 [Bacillus wiedmannii]|nr:hypothetical protein CN685_27270 [Bacillus wiedmannii]